MATEQDVSARFAPDMSPSKAGAPLASGRPADGHEQVYALLVSTADANFSLPSMVDFYHVLVDQHEVPEDQITYLVVSDTIPAGYESIIDGIATESAFVDALADLGSRADADDLLVVNFEGHGSGYLGIVPESSRNTAYHGFVYETPRVNQVGDGDRFDVLESNFELSLYCGGGTLYGQDCHAGLDDWAYSVSGNERAFRRMYRSHFDHVWVEGLGSISDSDEDIELLIDYSLGDTNQDGVIDTAAGETIDYDGDWIPCFDPATGNVDEDDWGPIDVFYNPTGTFHSSLGGIPFRVFDHNLDNQTDIDLYPVDGGPADVDGTDADNNGCINGLDVNDDGDQDDWVAMDETISLRDATITDDQLAATFNAIDCGTKLFITNSCFGGGFINDLSGPNTIIMTGSLETSEAYSGLFPGYLNQAFFAHADEADVDGNGRISLAEAFNFAAEHPYESCSPGMDLFLLDDNGDGVGHRGPLASGDEGTLAASVFLPEPTSVIISGRVWFDRMADGERMFNEPYLAGWKVYLDTNGNEAWDAGEPQTLTGGDGEYHFTGLAPGKYVVREVLEPGWRMADSSPSCYTVSADTPQAVTACNFTNQGAGAVGGVAWIDWNGDGVRDADDGAFVDREIRLRAADQSYYWITSTDASGEYRFENLPPGTYTVSFPDNAGWQHTAGDGSYQVTLGQDQTSAGEDFGEFPLYPVTGVVWEDWDDDGQRGPTDRVMPWLLVYIDVDNSGTPTAPDWTTTSSVDGTYLLSAPAAGTYTLRQSPYAGWGSCLPDSGSYTVTLALGQPVRGKDFAVRGLGSVSGVVYHDRDADGVHDPDEPGLPGRQLYIDRDYSGSFTAGDWSTVTAADGSYQLTGLDCGTQVIAGVLPAGWTDAQFGVRDVVLDVGQSATGIDFGNRGLGQISGRLWDDLDADGARDAGEALLSGWQVYIDFDASGTLTDGDWSTLSGGDGSYAFSNLGPGSYTLRPVVPSGWATTAPDGGASTVSLAAGESAAGRDFGNHHYQLDTPGLFDAESCTFYCRNSITTGVADRTFSFGDPTAGWTVVVGDWDGDGDDSVGFFDPAASVWYLRDSLTAGYADWTFGYGAPDAGWIPVVGDWDGNGSDTVGLFDPSACVWYLRNSLTTGFADITFGYGDPTMNATPLVGDWNGDRRAGVGLYVATTGSFYLRNELSTGFADSTFAFGDPTAPWKPLVGDWSGGGSDRIGLYDPASSTFYLRNSLSTGTADVTLGYGPGGRGWTALAGRWTIAPAAAALLNTAPDSDAAERDATPSTLLPTTLADAVLGIWDRER
jgi:hypothetical protein